ncbi:MAG: ORF6N domain-containing protein [Minisyncoccia bacterium]
MKRTIAPAILKTEGIESKILLVRGCRVMLDRDLAVLYGVRAIALRQQVRRNKNRFPEDFMFQISREEAKTLVSQNVIPSKRSLGGFLPYAFTEHGVAMLSSVLTGERAAQVNVAIMRAFVRFRSLLAAHKELARKIEAMERRYDGQFMVVFRAIKKLMEPPREKLDDKGQFGFRIDEKG